MTYVKKDPKPVSEHSAGSSRDTFTYVSAALLCVALFVALGWALLGSGRSAAPEEASQGALEIRSPQGMSWPVFQVDLSRLERERASARLAWRARGGEAALKSEEIQALHEIVRQMNDHQFTTHPIPSRAQEAMNHDLKIALGGVLERVEVSDFMRLGEPIFRECEEGLEAVMASIHQGETTLEEAMEDADFERFSSYRRHCGEMLSELKRRGLIDGSGRWVDDRARAMSSILERYRWAHLIGDYIEPLAQLTESERAAFLRWRVEDPHAFSMAQRATFLKDLSRHQPNYPEGMAEAMFLYEEGKKEEALEVLSRHHNRSPRSEVYGAMYEALKEEMK